MKNSLEKFVQAHVQTFSNPEWIPGIRDLIENVGGEGVIVSHLQDDEGKWNHKVTEVHFVAVGDLDVQEGTWTIKYYERALLPENVDHVICEKKINSTGLCMEDNGKTIYQFVPAWIHIKMSGRALFTDDLTKKYDTDPSLHLRDLTAYKTDASRPIDRVFCFMVVLDSSEYGRVVYQVSRFIGGIDIKGDFSIITEDCVGNRITLTESQDGKILARLDKTELGFAKIYNIGA